MVTVGVVSVVAVEVVSDRVDLTDVVSVAIKDRNIYGIEYKKMLLIKSMFISRWHFMFE